MASTSTSNRELPLISIVLTTFNSSATIEKVLEGITRQTYPHQKIELIIIDGGSNDSTLEILKKFYEEYKAEFADIKLIVHDKNYGVSRARNDGIKISRGKYVLILDHDVYMKNDTLMTLYQYLENSPPKVAAVVPLHINTSAPRLKRLEEVLFRGRVAKTFGATSCLLIRREVIEEVGLYDETLGPPHTIYEDIEYGARIATRGYEIHILGMHEVIHDAVEPGAANEKRHQQKRKPLGVALKALASLLNPSYKYAIRRFVKSLPLKYKILWYLYASVMPSMALVIAAFMSGYLYIIFIPLGLALVGYLTVLSYYLHPLHLHISLIYSAIAFTWRAIRAIVLLTPS